MSSEEQLFPKWSLYSQEAVSMENSSGEESLQSFVGVRFPRDM